MNYVIYADVMLIWIFFINYLTYYTTCRITNHRISQVKLILWSILSSLVLELLYITVIYKNSIIYSCIYICLNILLLMIFIRFILKLKSINSFFRLMFYNILGTFLLAGIIQVFAEENPSLHILIPLIFIICLIVPLIHHLYPTYRKESENLKAVTIITNNKAINTVGYFDTGNSLKDIYSGSPVIILEYSLLKEIITDFEYLLIEKYINTGNYEFISKLIIDGERLYPIPYKTISNEFSIMPAFRLKKLTINGTKIHENIVAGISSSKLSKNLEYKVLLNNNL